MIQNEKLKLISNIQEKITSFFPTDDNRVDPDYIWEQCKIVRNIYIEKLFQEDKRNVEDFFSRLVLPIKEYSDIELIPNEDYDPDDPASTETIDNPDYEPDFPELKRIIIPSLINLQGNIRYIGPTDRSDEYIRTTVDSFFHLEGRDFTSAKTFYLPFKDRIFFNKSPSHLLVRDMPDLVDYEEIEIWCLLEDPEDDPRWDSTLQGLIPKKYQMMLEETVVDMILKYKKGIVPDLLNDAADRDVVLSSPQEK
jgi:hypothetical protein